MCHIFLCIDLSLSQSLSLLVNQSFNLPVFISLSVSQSLSISLSLYVSLSLSVTPPLSLSFSLCGYGNRWRGCGGNQRCSFGKVSRRLQRLREKLFYRAQYFEEKNTFDFLRTGNMPILLHLGTERHLFG